MEFEAARQQEIANLNELHKNVQIDSVKLPENAKKDNTVPEKEDTPVSEKDEKAEGNPAEQEKCEDKQDKYEVTPKSEKYSNNNGSSGSRGGNKFRKGRNRNDNEDIRRPSGNATLFDYIRPQMVNPPPESKVGQHDNIQVNRGKNGGSYNNREGYNNAHQSCSSTIESDELAQVKVSDVPQDPPHGNNYRNGGTRGRGGGNRRGRAFYSNYGNPYQQHPQYQQQFPPIFAAPPPHPTMLPPPCGYVPPMPQHIRIPNVAIEVGKHVLAPFTDNNYYPGVVLTIDEVNGMSLIQYNHCPLPHFIHTEYLQLCNNQAQTEAQA
uniref:H/ACA ribonucleoprotein complex non-core subunit NAF1 n=1 Tax=Panagrolaimus sp. ES5 TaxID=591445 RepID=A0AC34GWP9_9BILA